MQTWVLWLVKALALDAGGTHCRLALVTAEDYQVVLAGGANAFSDIESCSRNILKAVDALSVKVNIEANKLVELPAYLGVAGAIDTSIAKDLQCRLPFKQVKIEDDRPSSLRGALGERDGFIAHCGTGSFFASQKKLNQAFAGGWGPLLDDVGSAYWVGIQALHTTLYADDGLASQSKLTECLMSEFKNAANLVIQSNNAMPGEVAALAKKVTSFASEGDANAKQILRKGAALIEDKLRQFGWVNGNNICLTGGIAVHYMPYLPEKFQACVVEPYGEPLDGAVALARAFYTDMCG